MSNKEAKAPVPFSVMNGDGETLDVGKNSYTVKPMLVGDALKFADEGLSIGSQIFNLVSLEMRQKLDGYLSKYCFDKKNEPMSIDRIVKEEWDVVHLKNFIRKLVDISG